MKPEIILRLDKRIAEIQAAKTPEELSYAIWSQGFEEATGSSKKPYRDCLIEWIKAYQESRPPTLWSKYKTPTELANSIWETYFDNNEDDKIWFGALRNELVTWIIKYRISKR